MKQTITKNDKNLNALNELIENNFYSGYVGSEKFELTRNHFPNNYKLTGVLNNTGNYDLRVKNKLLGDVSTKYMLILGVFISIILIILTNWVLSIVIGVIASIIYINIKRKEKKEINLFMNSLLEFYKANEYK